MKFFSFSGKVALFYMLLGSLWIIISDTILGYLLYPEIITGVSQTVKGLSFIIVTGVVLFWMVRRMDRTRAKTESEYIRESERYHALFDNAPVPMWYFDPQTLQFLDVNSAAVRHYGYSKQEFLAMTLGSIRVEESNQKVMPRIVADEYEQIQKKHRRKDGVVLDVEVHRHTVVLNGQSVKLAIILDRTEEKRLERERSAVEFALRESEQEALLLASVTKGSLDIIALHEPDGKILYITPSVVNTLGYEPSEMIGANARIFHHPNDTERTEAALRNVLDGKEQQITYRAKCKDGRYIWLESKLKPVLVSGTQEVARFEAFSRDVSEREQAYEDLQHSEAQFRSIIDFSPVPYAINDKNHTITYLNPAFIQTFGYTQSDIPTLSEWWLQAYPDEEYRQWVKTTWRKNVETAQREGIQFEELELTICCKDGSARTVLVSAAPLGKEFQDLHLVIFYDITDRKALDKALRESEERYRSLFNVLEEGVAINEALFDENGEVLDYVIIDVNPAFERHSPYTMTEALGRRATELYKMDADFIRAWWKKHIALTTITRTEYYHQPTDRWFDIVTTLPENGRFATIFINITDRKRAEEQLNLLSMVASKTSNAVIITDAAGYITWVNGGFLGISEFTREEVIGKKPGEILQGERTDPVTIQQMSNAIQAGQSFEVEIVNYSKSGRFYWVHIKADPFFDEANVLQGFIAIEQDSTHEKEQAEALMESYVEIQNFRTALETSAIVSMTDAQGKIVYANKAFTDISKYSAEELIGNDHTLVNSGYHAQGFFRQMWETITSGKSWRGEIRNRAKDGSHYWVETAISPMFDRQGEIYQYVSVRYEITERKRIEEELQIWTQVLEDRVEERTQELQELNREKDEILGIAAHDLKNPIAGIMIATEIVRHRLRQVEEQHLSVLPATAEKIIEKLKDIDITAERMLDIINKLLNVNKIESGKLTIQSIEFSLGTTVEAVVDLYQEYAHPKNITLRLENRAPEAMVVADPHFMQEVIENLVSNAVKYSPPGLSIDVRLLASDTAVRLEVQDYGPGISRSDMKKLFGKFARLTARPTGGENSTGLGLSIVKKLTEAMNGRVWCESELGKGAMFIVELPADGANEPFT